MKLFNITLNNLRRRKTKAFFMIMGMLIGVATIVTAFSISERMEMDIEERLDQFGANIVMSPKSKDLSLSYGGINVAGVQYDSIEFDEASLVKIRQIKNSENIGVVAPKILGAVELSGSQVLVMGVDFESELGLKTWLRYDGVFPEESNEIALGAEVAINKKLSVGDEIHLNDRKFLVSAVLKPTGSADDMVIMADLRTTQRLLDKPGKISLVEIAAFCRGCPITEMVLQIGEQFPNGRVVALAQAVSSKMQSIELFKTFSFSISTIALLIGSLLAFVTTMGSVNERTREIGIFRAIGFRSGHIMRIILLESLIVGFVSGILGGLFGVIVSNIVAPIITAKMGLFIPDPSLILGAILLSITLSIAAGIYPARKASKLDPTDALRVL